MWLGLPTSTLTGILLVNPIHKPDFSVPKPARKIWNQGHSTSVENISYVYGELLQYGERVFKSEER